MHQIAEYHDAFEKGIMQSALPKLCSFGTCHVDISEHFRTFVMWFEPSNHHTLLHEMDDVADTVAWVNAACPAFVFYMCS